MSHSANFYWSDWHRDRTRALGTRYVAPVRFQLGPPPWPDENTWSLICDFTDVVPATTSPVVATVSFLMEAAPHDRLTPGTKMWLYEGKDLVARVEVLD